MDSHDHLHLSGALTALTLKADVLPRRQRASVWDIARRSAAGILHQSRQRQAYLAACVASGVSREDELAYQIAALRDEQATLRYGPDYIATHLHALLREHPMADHVVNGTMGPNLIVTVGKAYLVDAWQNLVEPETMRFHGCGTSATAAGAGDTNLIAASTTVTNPDNVRATGTLTEASATVFRSVGRITFDGSATIAEWGLFSSATVGAGVMWSRVVLASTQAVVNTDAIDFTYDLTVS